MGMQLGCWTFGTEQSNRITDDPNRWLGISPGAKVVSSGGVTLAYKGESPIRVEHSKAPHGEILLLWDGRLDNGEDLLSELGGTCSENTDPEIAAACYGRWESDAFPKLIGDWSLCIWIPGTKSLILAKDFIGLRSMYYRLT